MRIVYLPMCLLLMSVVTGCTKEEPNPPPRLTPEEAEPEIIENDQEKAPQNGTKAKDGGAAKAEDGGAAKPKVSAKQVKQQLDEATEAVANYSEQKTDEALANAKKSLAELKEQTDAFQGDMGQLQQTAQKKLQQSVDELEKRLQAAQDQLGKLPAAGSEAWTEAVDDLQKTMDNLKAAYNDAASTFENAMAEDGKQASKQAGDGQQ